MPNGLKIAPQGLIARDFHDMSGHTRLECTWEMERALLQIAVASHAHSGHGAYQGHKYPNTTEDHVARALGMDARFERELRQRWIDEVRAYAEAAINGKAPRFAINPEGMPLFGIGLFRWLEVEPRDVLVGLVLGGCRDNPEWRKKAQDTYGIDIGYGQAHPVDVQALAKAGLDGGTLAREGHEEDLARLRSEGVILPDETEQSGNVQNLYVRYQTGPGASDDTSFLAAGKLYGLGAAVGCYLADAIDTLEKYTPIHADQDDLIAEMIRARMPDLVTDDQITHLTFLASTPPELLDTLPDTTMRHFLLLDPNVDQCILESHFLYLTGRPWLPMVMGHHPLMNNEELYGYVEELVKRNPK